ncbi:MAG: DUF6259 domain-containing protein [Armatimonadota bacterium]|nr:DUF6259 domain-containing protein [Armatimonadota bacterium]
MMRRCVVVTLLVALAVPGAAAVWQAPGLAIEHSDAAPLGIVALRPSADGPALFLDPDSVEITWELTMVDPEGKELSIDPVSRELGGQVERQGDSLLMVWEATEVPGGSVKVACRFAPAPAADCRPGSPLVYGLIEVVNESACQLRAVQFPRLTFVPGPSEPHEITLVFPRAYGRSWRNPFDAPYGYLVGTMEPAGHAGGMEMQFGTLYDDAGNGLYWAFHDGDGYHKRVVYDNKVAPGTIVFKMEHVPENCLTPGQDYRSTYPVALGAYEGDWWDAARIYREWALGQKWAQAGPIETRQDAAEWVKHADVWIRGDARRYSPELAAEFTYELQDIAGGTFGVQLYSWYQREPGAHSWSSTLGWPMVEGYPEMIAEARGRGVHHTPYVNSLQTDLEDPSCPQGIQSAFALDASGRALRWSEEGEQYIMCAATETWKDMLVRACERLVRDGNASGVYLDQLGGHCSRPCYSPDHGHPVGGGAYATDGLRQICQAIREAMWRHYPEAALSGEVQHEMLLDVTDHRLMHYNYWPGWVNLWAAVYGDYTVTYGRTISFAQTPRSDGTPRQPIEFFGPMGNTLVSGMAFGRIWPTGNPQNLLSSPGNEAKKQYFITCVDLRCAARKFLEFGYLQRPVRIPAYIPQVPIDDPKGRPSAIDAVLHSSWRASDGSLGFVFTNVSEEVQEFDWVADLSTYEIAPAEVYRVQRILPDGTRRKVADLQMPTLQRSEELQPHDVMVYEVTVAE